MALTDSAVIIPGTGEIWVAPLGTPKPTILTAPAYPWVNVGHTSSDDNFAIRRDGGDSNIKGTWQNPALRDAPDPVVYSVTFTLLQFDNVSLGLYFGGGDKSVDGVFGVPISPTAQQRALYIRVIDGDVSLPLYIPKTSIKSDDDIETDTEEFMPMPCRATILGVTGSNLMEWLGDNLGLLSNESQTVTITGTPTGGTFTLTFAGQTTDGIAYNAASTAVASALAALSSVGGSSNVSVSGSAGGPYTVTFQGALAGQDVPQMTATSSLTGGTSPAVTVTTATQGGS